MVGEAPESRFHFDPSTYLSMVRSEVPSYAELQHQVALATADRHVRDVLDLGMGTGETSAGVCRHHPDAHLVGVDESAAMLEVARRRFPGADLHVQRLEDPLPDGPFDLVVSALAVHHLDALAKQDLFARVHACLRPSGRFVLADVVVPERPEDAVTPIDGDGYDKPSRADEQHEWLERAGFVASVAWAERDLVVLRADRPEGG